MKDSLWDFALKAFVTLTVVVDPLGVAPNFVALTSEYGTIERKQILTRASVVAFTVTLFFLLCGRWLLSYLGVTVQPFAISGGVLLFVAAWPMLFGHRPGLQAPENNKQGAVGEDIAIFPLAIPLLSGPGTITTVLLLTNQPNADIARMMTLAAIILAALAVQFILNPSAASMNPWLVRQGNRRGSMMEDRRWRSESKRPGSLC